MTMGDQNIAGTLTARDWWQFRKGLEPGGVPALWKTAFEKFLKQRLALRYLDPIAVLQEHGSYRGEGFSIVALHCTLIEFLAATVAGKNYRFVRPGDPKLGDFEYSKSGQLFVEFLARYEPFRRDFTRNVALDFYAGVRCGLLHEAQTKNGWRIWVMSLDSGAEIDHLPSIDARRRLVFRTNLHGNLLRFVEQYGISLQTEIPLQQAFIRKFDSLAGQQ
jgi:hypothetical protein